MDSIGNQLLFSVVPFSIFLRKKAIQTLGVHLKSTVHLTKVFVQPGKSKTRVNQCESRVYSVIWRYSTLDRERTGVCTTRQNSLFSPRFFRESKQFFSGKRMPSFWMTVFLLDTTGSFPKRRNFAHLSVHSVDICVWYIVFIMLALHCSFQLVLKIYFIVESTLHDTLGGVVQSYTRSGAQKQRENWRF